MNLYEQFQTDEQLELDGVWIPIGRDARIRVARMDNQRYRDAVKRLAAPYRQNGVMAEIPDETWRELTKEAFAEAILVDWDGITGPDGQPVPYSKKEALAALSGLKDFFKIVALAAENMENYRVARQKQVEKN